MGFICFHFLAVVVQTWVWSKDAMFGFSVPHREKLCAIIRVKNGDLAQRAEALVFYNTK
jgi:hypothetical protein